MMKRCAVPDCDRPWHCRDWCSLHYERVRVYGDPMPVFAPRRSRPLAARFDSHVDRSAGPAACWPFRGALTIDGYGRILNERDAQPRVLKGHQLAWRYAHGSVPTGMCVLHRCDNPRCCNPAHLFLGTQADNVADMDAKGRRGWIGYRAKLTLAKAREIRASRESITVLAARYGVSRTTIIDTRGGRRWREPAA